MLTKIEQYIAQYQLFGHNDKVLLACSGGIDSMVLLHLLKILEYNTTVAHCNFNLRGEESNTDEQFIINYCTKNNIPFFTKSFNTLDEKKQSKQSTQMIARTLRYEWFEQLRNENKIDFIVTAHHANDQLETILLNLTKGTGLNGLKGMLPKNNFVVRPMLSVTKNEIVAFANQHNIAFREDSSNASIDYQRNLLRHEVVPVLEKINPSLLENIEHFSKYMSDYNTLVEQDLMQYITKKCVFINNAVVAINFNYFRKHPAVKTILFQLLKAYEFNANQIQDIYSNIIEQQSGKQYFSNSHRLVVDRKQLFVADLNSSKTNYLLFDKIPNQILFNNYKIQCKIAPIDKVNIKKSSNYAYVDADKIQLPLLIRYWKQADYFYPFGLSKLKNPNKVGKKKLSKYFKDEKFSQIDKEQTPILFANEKLIWLIGHRIDDRFKITNETKMVLKLKIVKQ